MALVPFPGAAAPDPDDDDRDASTDPDDGSARMSFLDHLDELRRRLIASVYGLIGGCVIAFIFVGKIQAFIMVPLWEQLGGRQFIYTQGFEPFMLTMKIGALGGLLISCPFIMWQLWLFIAPGLYTHEKKFAVPFVVMSSTFFLLGTAFSHYAAFPWTWKFFLGWQTPYLQFLPNVGEAFSLYVKMMLAFGLIFQMPTLVLFLTRMGLVTAGMLARHTKYAVLGIFIIAAVISPGTDVVSQALMAGPMIGLYGFSILISWIFRKPKTDE